jgi:hypothetical protein
VRTQSPYAANDLVPEDRGVTRDDPLVGQDREIGVTQSAMLNRDLNVLDHP